MPVRSRLLASTAAIALVATACGTDTATTPEGIFASNDLDVSVVLTDLAQPTQFFIEPSNPASIVIAEINGGENDTTGQVSRIELPPNGESRNASRAILFDGLDKPTGVALYDDQIWVMQKERLTRGPQGGGELTTEIGELPNNGRSQGTLTNTGPTLLFDVSGRKRGEGTDTTITEGSGRLFSVGESKGAYDIVEIASGFKHAYAHVISGGILWTTEVTDGTFDGEAASDEVVAVATGVDHGWPHCVDNNRPVSEFDGSEQRCAGVPESLALLGIGATPTSIVESPWDSGELLIALWNTGEVVAVRTAEPGSQPRVVIRGLANPQHLVVHKGRLLISEFGTGRLLQVARR